MAWTKIMLLSAEMTFHVVILQQLSNCCQRQTYITNSIWTLNKGILIFFTCQCQSNVFLVTIQMRHEWLLMYTITPWNVTDTFMCCTSYIFQTEVKHLTRFIKSVTDYKNRTLSGLLNDFFAKFYNLSENLAVEEIMWNLKGRMVFKQHIPKKHKHFGITIFKLSESMSYTYVRV